MRNYRDITRDSNLAAWGMGLSQAIGEELLNTNVNTEPYELPIITKQIKTDLEILLNSNIDIIKFTMPIITVDKKDLVNQIVFSSKVNITNE